MSEKYNIGLDIGDASVGWAVTDEQAHLIKHKGKNLWGVRLFDRGETAEARRLSRGSRRRNERRKQRIKCIQELFAKEISELDNNFFARLKESFLQPEDSSILSISTLFDDKSYSDKQYYTDFPTIYHLRKKLLYSNEKADLRLIYLALHHIFKYRGNFLYGKSDLSEFSSNSTDNFEIVFTKIFKEEYPFDKDAINEAIKVLRSDISKRMKQEYLQNLLLIKDKGIDNKVKEIIKAILGYKFNVVKLFEVEEIDENLKSITFTDELDIEKFEGVLLDNVDILISLQSIYNWMALEELLGDVGSNNPADKTISNAMVVKYDNHKKQLKMLKSLVRDVCSKEDYSKMFRKNETETNYTNYIKNANKNSYYLANSKQHTLEKFNSFIKKTLDKYPEAKEHKNFEYVSSLLEEKNLLSKLNTVENSVIPYQLHKVELEKILDKQGIHYPFLKSNKEFLVKVLVSRIPYYVGPLNENSQFSWVVKKNDGKGIYPWNYEEVVDELETATKFIKRMTTKCTYLYEEDVLPRHSLTYSEFVLLNELNKVKVNGKCIDKYTKSEIIEALFKEQKTVKNKDIVNWIKKNPKGFIKNSNDEIKIEGTQKENEFAASLASYIDFKKILGDVNETNFSMVEELINWITIFEDKEILRRKIKQRKDFDLDNNQIEKIVKLRYKGWARLSVELIDRIKNTKDSKHLGETILGIMRGTNYNFMQIINESRFDFKQVIEELNPCERKEKLMYEDIDSLHGSPAIKRGIWQATKIVAEIVDAMGAEPDNIFIEFARSDEESKRTTSRAKHLEQVYKAIKVDANMFNKEVDENLKKVIGARNKLDDRALFLYFTQNGKCMYTGKPLDLDLISQYQVDHIIPRSFIKDDSLDNVVLVTTKENQVKGNNLLLSPEIRGRQAVFWENLYKCGLISKKKLDNLNRSCIPDKELIGFINRQLVETRQISKHVADLMSQAYSDTRIMSIKARLISDFRKKYELYKTREINDLHHAHDALVLSVIGNFTLKRFPNLEDELNIKDYIHRYKKNNLLKDNKNKYGFILSSMDKDYSSNGFQWIPSLEIDRVKKALSYKDCFITKKIETQTGKFYDESIYPSKHPNATIPTKKGLDPKRYGGHSGENNSYYAVIEYKKKNKIVKKLIGVPMHIAYRQDKNVTLNFIIESENITDEESLKIVKDQIKKYQLVEYNGQEMYLVSHTEMQNAVQLIVDDRYKELLYMITKGQELEKGSEHETLLISLLDYLLGKIENHYPLYRTDISVKVMESREDFKEFSLEDKVQFIKQMLKVTSVGPEKGDFKKFATQMKSAEAGRVRNRSKGGWDLKNMVFIDRSITGIFERRYKI